MRAQKGPCINFQAHFNWHFFITCGLTKVKYSMAGVINDHFDVNGNQCYLLYSRWVELSTRPSSKVLTKFWIVIFWAQITDADNMSSHLYEGLNSETGKVLLP